MNALKLVKSALVSGSRLITTFHGRVKLPKRHDASPGPDVVTIYHRGANRDDLPALIDLMTEEYWPVVYSKKFHINPLAQTRDLESDLKSSTKLTIVAYHEDGQDDGKSKLV